MMTQIDLHCYAASGISVYLWFKLCLMRCSVIAVLLFEALNAGRIVRLARTSTVDVFCKVSRERSLHMQASIEWSI